MEPEAQQIGMLRHHRTCACANEGAVVRARAPFTRADVPTSQLDFSCCIQYTRRLTSIKVLTLEGGGHHDVSTTQSSRFKRCRSRPCQPHHAHHAEAPC